MSDSNGDGKLSVNAAAGVAFRVLDAANTVIVEESGKLTLDLKPGLYAINWQTSDKDAETIVRVSPAETTVADFGTDAPTLLTDSNPSLVAVSQVVDQLQPLGSDQGSSIFVVVASKTAGDAQKGLAGLRIHDARESTVPALDQPPSSIRLRPGEVARSFFVRPGRYQISYTGLTGETIRQSVPALKGRQTVVLLKSRRGDVLQTSGDRFVRKNILGIDPTTSVIVTVRGNETQAEIRKSLRLMGLLLRGLETGAPALTTSFLSVIRKRNADPLLKLAASITVIARIEQGGSPAIDEKVPPRSEYPGFRTKWLELAASWLRRQSFHELPTDFVAAWWQLEKLGGAKPIAPVPSKLPAAIDTPPLFSCSWRWAACRSVETTDTLRLTPSIIAAARSASGHQPWLVWNSSAAKALPSSLWKSDNRSTEQLARDTVRSVSKLLNLWEGPRASALLQQLGPELGAMALQLRGLVGREELGSPLASILASTMALPNRTLRHRLLSTEKEIAKTLFPKAEESADLRTAVGSRAGSIGRSTSKKLSRAPALSRAVKVPDDPNKGRFGRHASANGFTLCARFPNQKTSEWTKIEILVFATGVEHQVVQFYLHDSFRPSLIEEKLKNGKASLTLSAWGGFTVGVWIPSKRTELELDLSQLPDAPTNIRYR